MRLAVLKERRADETRVAATPETVRKLVALGLQVAIEAGAGQHASIPDADFTAAGAEVTPDAQATLANAGVVFAVQTPEQAELALIPRGALLVCISGALANRDVVPALAQAGIDTAAMELLPRITRAQSMDILSSQANLAGYRAVIEGAHAFDRGFAMMMTAAGTVPPARVFVVGAGVAGLQAIATARRLGAIVSATDVRPAAKEEIRSLGATFVGVEDDETAKQTGAYAREMTDDFRRKQAELMTATVAKNDMVICTALVQGGKAPVLVSQAMVDGMRPGSVVVDIAADGGGNCAATHPGEMYVTANGVKVLGYRNWPGRIPVASSSLYAKNLLTFLTTFWDKDAKAPKLPPEDTIVQGVMLTRGGQVVHAQFGTAAASPAAGQPASAATEPEAPLATPMGAEPPGKDGRPPVPAATGQTASEPKAAPHDPSAGTAANAGAAQPAASSAKPAQPAAAPSAPSRPGETSPPTAKSTMSDAVADGPEAVGAHPDQSALQPPAAPAHDSPEAIGASPATPGDAHPGPADTGSDQDTTPVPSPASGSATRDGPTPGSAAGPAFVSSAEPAATSSAGSASASSAGPALGPTSEPASGAVSGLDPAPSALASPAEGSEATSSAMPASGLAAEAASDDASVPVSTESGQTGPAAFNQAGRQAGKKPRGPKPNTKPDSPAAR